MREPIQITIRDLPHDPELEDKLLKKAEKLATFSENIISCQVVVELAQKNQQRGKLHNVRVNVNLPGKDLITNSHLDEDLNIAIREAFHSVERQIKQANEELHGQTKTHPEHMQGEIVRIFDEGFGFIESNGNEYYFNTNNITHTNFDKLTIGTKVHFVESMADSGLQAQKVRVAKRQPDGEL